MTGVWLRKVKNMGATTSISCSSGYKSAANVVPNPTCSTTAVAVQCGVHLDRQVGILP